MPTIKLTEKAIARLPAPDPSGSQRLYFDTQLRGFAVLVSGVSNSKSYVVQRAIAGKTRRVTIAPTNAVKLAVATKRAKEIVALFFRGVDPKAGRRGEATLRSALADYLEVRSDLRPRSAAAYRDVVERHLSPWADTALRSITREMVERRHRQIAESIAAETDHSGRATANSAMRTFRVLFNFSADRAPATNPMPPSPVRLKKIWFEVPPRTRNLGPADLPKFYQAVMALPNPVHRDYLLILLFCGLRRREAAGLRWEYVDFKEKTIKLPASVTKARRALALPMSDIIFDMLVARRALGDTTWIFPAASVSGHVEEPKYPLELIAEATGIRVNAHDLRRSYITIAESTDISVMALKALVNHSLGKDVTSGYVQMTPERLREPVQKVADKIKELCGIAPPVGGNVRKMRK